MFMVLGFLLAVVWVIAVAVFKVTAASIHVLLGLVAASVVLHLINVRKFRGPAGVIPKDAIK